MVNNLPVRNSMTSIRLFSQLWFPTSSRLRHRSRSKRWTLTCTVGNGPLPSMVSRVKTRKRKQTRQACVNLGTSHLIPDASTSDFATCHHLAQKDNAGSLSVSATLPNATSGSATRKTSEHSKTLSALVPIFPRCFAR